MEVRIHLILRFAITIQARDSRAADPLVARVKLGANTRHLSGNPCAKRMPWNGLQDVAQQVVRVIYRRKRAGDGVKRGEFGVSFQFFAKCDARPPIARGATVIGKAFGKIVLEVISGWQAISAQAVDRYVAVIVVKSGELKNSARTDLAVCGDFLMPAILQNRTAIAHQQSGESIQLIESCG